MFVTWNNDMELEELEDVALCGTEVYQVYIPRRCLWRFWEPEEVLKEPHHKFFNQKGSRFITGVKQAGDNLLSMV